VKKNFPGLAIAIRMFLPGSYSEISGYLVISMHW